MKTNRPAPYLLILFLLCSFLLLCLTVYAPSSYASKQIVVTPQDDLQQIINEAPVSSTILLMEGSYSGPIVLKSSVSIIGEEGKDVRLVNDSEQSAITIYAPNVTLSGLFIKDEVIKTNPTIQVAADDVSLNNLKIITGSDGISAVDSNNGKVQQTKIEWVDNRITRSNRGNGIDLYQSNHWEIIGNRISEMHDGVYLERSNATIISDCVIEFSRYAFHMMYASNSELHNNIGKMNVTGAMIMTSNHITVKENSFAKQLENLNSQGILFYDTHDSVIEANYVDGNRVGLYIEMSNNNKFMNNQISNNFIGFQWLNSTDNGVTQNSFIGNVSDVQNRGVSANNITMNYWDGFKAIDINGDHISDIAYSINPFYFDVIQKQASFQLFFQSPGMLFLEDLFAIDSSSWMTDTKPSMIPPQLKHSEEKSDNPLDTLIISIILLIFATLIIYKSRREAR